MKYSRLSPIVTEKNTKPKNTKLVRIGPENEGSRLPEKESRRPLFGLDAAELASVMVEAGEPAFRGKQLAEALYRQRVAGLDAITTLSKSLRQRLAGDGWQVGRPGIAQVFQSVDGTERYLVECGGAEGLTVETVWMPEGDGGETGDGSGIEAEGADAIVSGAGRGLPSAFRARWVARSTASSA